MHKHRDVVLGEYTQMPVQKRGRGDAWWKPQAATFTSFAFLRSSEVRIFSAKNVYSALPAMIEWGGKREGGRDREKRGSWKERERREGVGKREREERELEKEREKRGSWKKRGRERRELEQGRLAHAHAHAHAHARFGKAELSGEPSAFLSCTRSRPRVK